MRGRGWFGWGGSWGWRPGRGRGNPYPFCRNFPWLPRRWWAAPYTDYYGAATPYMGMVIHTIVPTTQPIPLTKGSSH